MLKFLMWIVWAGILAIFWVASVVEALNGFFDFRNGSVAPGNGLLIFFPLSVVFFVAMMTAVFKAFYHFAKHHE